MNRIEVALLDKRFVRFEKPFARLTQRVFKYMGLENRSLEIYLVNSSQMQELNFQYRKKDKPTDVLAVESPGFPEKGQVSLGEIYICPPQLKEKSYTIEYALIHGILHLLGFNHAGVSDKMKMERKEKEILEWLEHTS